LEARGTVEERSAIDRIESAELRQLVEAALSVPEAHGPYQLVEHFPFPIEQYLLLLFRSRRLVATGKLPNETLTKEITPPNWAALEIAISENTGRLGVWCIRTANRSDNMRRILGREGLHCGAGDLENVRVQRTEVLEVFPTNAPTDEKSEQDGDGRASKNKRGRPSAVDWNVVKTEMFRLMDYHMDFGTDAPEWNAQARLEEKLEDFCDDKFRKRPGPTTIRKHIAPWLAEWRNRKTATVRKSEI
jgi:hypothetical protein